MSGFGVLTVLEVGAVEFDQERRALAAPAGVELRDACQRLQVVEELLALLLLVDVDALYGDGCAVFEDSTVDEPSGALADYFVEGEVLGVLERGFEGE